jgi:crotonobetainyl-CoA:carnitine CoA-transferase CaiB-like acyl-CoA transferase
MVASYWLGGVAPKRVGNRGFVGSPGADTFPTADGWISTAANTRGQFEAMCRVLGRPDIITNATLLPKLPDSRDGFLTDLASEALRNELVSAFAAASSSVWEERLTAAGVAASKVHTLPSYLDGHYLHTGRIDCELPVHPQGRGTPPRILNEGVRWIGEQARPPGEAPRLGQHTQEVLAELSAEAER